MAVCTTDELRGFSVASGTKTHPCLNHSGYHCHAHYSKLECSLPVSVTAILEMRLLGSRNIAEVPAVFNKASCPHES